MSGVSGAAMLSPSFSSSSGKQKKRERYVTGSWSDRGIMVCEKEEEARAEGGTEGREDL